MATCEHCDQWIVHDMNYHLAHCDKARIAKLEAQLARARDMYYHLLNVARLTQVIITDMDQAMSEYDEKVTGNE